MIFLVNIKKINVKLRLSSHALAIETNKAENRNGRK